MQLKIWIIMLLAVQLVMKSHLLVLKYVING